MSPITRLQRLLKKLGYNSVIKAERLIPKRFHDKIKQNGLQDIEIKLPQ